MTSFLLMAEVPSRFPVYQADPFNMAYRLTGHALPDLPIAREPAFKYRHAMAFLGRLMEEASARGLRLRDRLGTQSVVWVITRWDSVESWGKEDQVTAA